MNEANKPQERQRSHKVRVNEPKGEKKRRAACIDTPSGKTERRIVWKKAGERKWKLLKKNKKGRKTNERDDETNSHDRTLTDAEEKSEPPISEYGVRHSSRSSPTGEKEEDTEAKSTRREH